MAEKKQKNGFSFFISALAILACFWTNPTGASAAFSLPSDGDTLFLQQDILSAATSETILEDAVPLSGTHEVLVSMNHPSGGELDTVTLMGENGEITITSGEAATTIHSGYDFDASESKLGIQVRPVSEKYGNAVLTFTIKANSDITVMSSIDTRFLETINVGTEGYVGQKYGADPYGWRLNFRPEEGEDNERKGVTVTGTRVTGMIWSQVFGWVDLQAPGGGILTTVVNGDKTNLDGLAWNEQIGWIDFGPQDTDEGEKGGVYIDENGYFQGTAWSENFGYLSFGSYIEADPVPDNEGAIAMSISDWARTTWSPKSFSAPDITLVGPEDLVSIATRYPLFSFHIEDEDGWDKVGYNLYIAKKTGEDFLSYTSHDEPATLDTNGENENYTYSFAEEFTPGEYEWYMTAKDEKGMVSEETIRRTFTITNEAPTVTLLTPIENEDVGKRPTLTFTIDDSDGDKMSYLAQISSSASSFEADDIVAYSSLQEDNVSGEYEYTPFDSVPAGQLYWRVIVEDIHGGQVISPVRSITVGNSAPEIKDITLQNSAGVVIPEGEKTIDNTPILHWTSVDDSNGLSILSTVEVYDSDNAFVWGSEGRKHKQGIEQRRTFTALNSGEDYSYRIQSCDTDGSCSPWETGNFSIEPGIRIGNVGTSDILGKYLDSMVGNTTGHTIPSHITMDADDIPPAPETAGWVDNDSSDNKHIWSQSSGWIDMNPLSGGVIVESDRVRGFAWSDSLGWIRMHCGPYNAKPEDGDTGDCGLRDINNDGDINELDEYGVLNDGLGNLSGKALVESTGNFFYFDRASYLEDHPPIIPNDEGAIEAYWNALSPEADINVSISCESGYRGHFFGYAYSPDLGWIVLGRAELYGYLDAASKDTPSQIAANFFPITEWSCDQSNTPVLLEENYYTVTAAKTSGVSVAIAKTKNEGDPSVTCSDMKVTPVIVADNGSVTADVNIPVPCTTNTDGEAIITLPSEYSEKTGVYRITGTVGNDDGESISLPIAGVANNQFIVQIVAAQPNLSHSDTITQEKRRNNVVLPSNENLIADGEDIMKINVTLYDTFDNPIVSDYKYQNSSFEQLKEATLKVIFENNVVTDQIKGTTSEGTPPVDGIPLSNVLTSTNNNIMVEINSIAPTTLGYGLSIKNIGSLVEAKSNLGSDLGQTENGGDWVLDAPINGDISFYPVLSATVSNFSEFASTFNNTKASLGITLKNESSNINLTEYRWIGMARKKNIIGDYVDTVYQSTQASQNSNQSTTNNYWQELKYNLGSNDSSEFGGIFWLMLPDTENTYNVHGSEDILQGINSNLSTSFSFQAYVVNGTSEEQKIPEFRQYAAVRLSENGSIIKFPLGVEQQYGSNENIKLSIAGATHGEEFNENIIVSESAAFEDFTTSEQVYTRQEIRQIMYSNYKSMTGLLTPAYIDPDGDEEKIIFNDYADFITDNGGNMWIQNGSVRWVEKKGGVANVLGVVVGDEDGTEDFNVDNDEGAKTLMVYGGNVYIEDNITIGKNSNLGIMALSSRENSESGIEGNIFIDPAVTHIDGVLYADGSIMSAHDSNNNGIIEESEIFDGFGDEDDDATFSNQLYISGSIVSQNTAGTLGKDEDENVVLMSNVWMPLECTSTECTDSQDLEKAAMRYDFSYMRHFGLLNTYNDADKDLIRDDKDCDQVSNPAAIGCTPITNEDDDVTGHYNVQCQNEDGTINSAVYTAENCAPIVTTKTAKNNGQCADGTDWCNCETAECSIEGVVDIPFAVKCEETDAPCDENGSLINPKIGAAVIIEYDPTVQTLTPAGMTLPSETTFD